MRNFDMPDKKAVPNFHEMMFENDTIRLLKMWPNRHKYTDQEKLAALGKVDTDLIDPRRKPR